MLDNNATPAKRHLLIITGPQGSGNHLFSRIFSWHPAVRGWDALQDNYWVPSDQEPLAKYWVHPEEFNVEKEFADKQYLVANVSAPFFYDGVRQFPQIEEVIRRARAADVEVTVAIVTRDHTINGDQQQRVGGQRTLNDAVSHYLELIANQDTDDFSVHFISHEAVFLWRNTYVQYLSKLLKTPVDLDHCLLGLDVPPNHKYIRTVTEHWLDEEIRAGRRPFADRVVDRLRGNYESH